MASMMLATRDETDAGDDDDLAVVVEDGATDGVPMAASVPDDIGAERIDRIAARLFSQYSRARLQQWIDAGRLFVDGVAAGAKTRLRGGETLALHPMREPSERAFAPEPVDFRVVAADAAVIVIDKPAGLVVHPAAGNWSGTLLNGLLHRWPELLQIPRAGIVHRLDKDTTGLMVVARTIESQTALVRQLQARSVKREYAALCWGRVASRTIDAPIGRDPRDRVRMAVAPGGKPSVTHIQPLRIGMLESREVTLVRCALETGRTHQIRVHLASIGHALVGDATYAPRALQAVTRRAFARQALHAQRLAFVHPDTGAIASFDAPLPDDLATLLADAGIDLPQERA